MFAMMLSESVSLPTASAKKLCQQKTSFSCRVPSVLKKVLRPRICWPYCRVSFNAVRFGAGLHFIHIPFCIQYFRRHGMMHVVVAWHGNRQYYGSVITDTLSVNPILNTISTNFVILKHYMLTVTM